MTRAGLVNVQHFGMTFGTVYLHIRHTRGDSGPREEAPGEV